MFKHPIEVAGTSAGPFERLDAFVDTGYFYTKIPGSILRRLGVTSFDRAVFMMADGRRTESDLGEIRLRIDGRERPAICVFGDENAPILLGAHALEGFLLAADPVNERLVPIEGLMLTQVFCDP